MENHRRQKANSTGDIFTFPSMSPCLEFESELADQLFSNGKFLLHTFQVQPPSFTIPRSIIMSRTSSSSKSSLMSSRSNSTNSRVSNSSSNSSCSSTRTSISEAKLSPINQAKYVAVKTPSINQRSPNKDCHIRNYCNNYGHSQKWQFISPVPVVNRRSSSKRRKGRKGKRDRDVRKGVCKRFFGWLVSICQECHAIEPSKRLKVSI
ncbi:hypothetical protein R6Q57_025883 [Mikania cordata]